MHISKGMLSESVFWSYTIRIKSMLDVSQACWNDFNLKGLFGGVADV